MGNCLHLKDSHGYRKVSQVLYDSAGGFPIIKLPILVLKVVLSLHRRRTKRFSTPMRKLSLDIAKAVHK